MEIRDRLYIGGAWVVPVRTELIEVLDSTTEEIIGSVPRGTAEDASRAVEAARGAFDDWARTCLLYTSDVYKRQMRAKATSDSASTPTATSNHPASRWESSVDAPASSTP